MPSRDPKDLCITLQIFWPKLKAWYEAKFPERRLILTCTHRTVEEQQALFKQNAKTGKIVTQLDGINKLSKHNYLPALAMDIAVVISGKAEWGVDFYKPLGGAIGELGFNGKIRWGGWFSFRDFPHFETI